MVSATKSFLRIEKRTIVLNIFNELKFTAKNRPIPSGPGLACLEASESEVETSGMAVERVGGNRPLSFGATFTRPAWDLPRLGQPSRGPVWDLPRLGQPSRGPVWDLPRLRQPSREPVWDLPRLGQPSREPVWDLPRLGQPSRGPVWDLPRLGQPVFRMINFRNFRLRERRYRPLFEL